MSREEKKKKKKEEDDPVIIGLPPISGLMSILLSAGFGAALAIAITEATNEEEKIPKFIKDKKKPVIFMTKMDSKVDDKICLPLEGTVWDLDNDPKRPKIPKDTHPNCRCFYIDGITGRKLGQI